MTQSLRETPAAGTIERRLRDAGVMPTRQRVDIAEIMLERAQHLSADQLIARLRDRGRTAVSKATVYNTLGLFARVGLLREVIADPARVFYDSNTDEHHHLFDEDTGELVDLAPGLVDVTALPELPEGTSIRGVEVVVRVSRRGD